MAEVLTLPVSGTMHIRHSKKLEWALRDFITSNGGTYYDDEIKYGIISCYFILDNEICVEQKVHIRKNDYICYTNLSCSIDPKDKTQAGKCIQMANSINLELECGNFEVNSQKGDILFRSFYEPDDKVSQQGLFRLLVYPRRMINKFGHHFLMLTEK